MKLFDIIKETEIKHEKSKESRDAHQVDMIAIEIRLDDKLSTFMEAYDKSFDTKIKNICGTFDKKIISMQILLTNLKVNIQNQIDGLRTTIDKIATPNTLELPSSDVMNTKLEELQNLRNQVNKQ